MKKSLLLPVSFAIAALSAQGTIIIGEGFDYSTSGGYDVDGGLNSGNGLPATNVGGNPSGTSTGIRGGTWGGSIVSGSLSYGDLLTSGNSLRAASGYGSETYVYRNMTTDPFNSLRLPPSGGNSGNFGVDGDTIWFSFLMNTNAVGDGIRSSLLIGDGSTKIGIGINAVAATGGSADKFTMDLGTLGLASGSNTSTVVGTASSTYLLVGNIVFQAGGDQMNWWINPTIGGSLGTADIALTTTNSFAGVNRLQTRVDGATVIFDEIRMGTSFEAVTPVPEPSTYALLAGLATLGLALIRRRRK